ncbi:hypothetical protein C8R45DRAFT_1220474 [Mycena sanguinolenta]|nr:hypothetical protein C8R45DRAFT_1220474 [Mycena sanguinolenta]
MTTMTDFEKLPFELHSKIFLHCLPLDGRPLASDCASDTRALEFGIFPHDSEYHGLSFLFGYETTPAIDRTVALVDLWFRRSNGYPLSITIRCLQRGLRFPPGLMRVLTNRSDQWQRLELMLSRLDFVELDGASGPFTCLRSLALNVNDHLSPSFTWNRDRYTQAPSLTLLRLGSSLCRASLLTGEATKITATRLTALEFSTTDPALIVSIIHHLPHLQHLIIHRVHVYHPFMSSPVPVTASLTCLILDGAVEHDVLDFITLPALNHLGVNLQNAEGSTAVVSFVARSRCVLTRLTLRSAFITLGTWSALLPVADRVPTLELNETAFLHVQADLRSHITPLPRDGLFGLRTLILSTFDEDIYDQLFAFIAARLALNRVQLRLLYASRAWEPIPPPSDEVVASLRALTVAGLHITLETPTYRWPEETWDDIDGDYNVFNPQNRLPFDTR